MMHVHKSLYPENVWRSVHVHSAKGHCLHQDLGGGAAALPHHGFPADKTIIFPVSRAQSDIRQSYKQS